MQDKKLKLEGKFTYYMPFQFDKVRDLRKIGREAFVRALLARSCIKYYLYTLHKDGYTVGLEGMSGQLCAAD